MFCPVCGKEIRDGSAACQYCGTQFNENITDYELEPAKPLTGDSHYDLAERYRETTNRAPQPATPPTVYVQTPTPPPTVYVQTPTPPPQPTVYVVNNQPYVPPVHRNPGISEEQRLENYSSAARSRGIVALVFSTLGWISLLIMTIADPQKYTTYSSYAYSRRVYTSEYRFLLVQTVIGFILMIPGLILSIVGLSSSLRYRSRKGKHNGNSVAGMVCSIIALTFVIVTVFLAIPILEDL